VRQSERTFTLAALKIGASQLPTAQNHVTGHQTQKALINSLIHASLKASTFPVREQQHGRTINPTAPPGEYNYKTC